MLTPHHLNKYLNYFITNGNAQSVMELVKMLSLPFSIHRKLRIPFIEKEWNSFWKIVGLRKLSVLIYILLLIMMAECEQAISYAWKLVARQHNNKKLP